MTTMLQSPRNRGVYDVDDPWDGDGFYRYLKPTRRRRALRRRERVDVQREIAQAIQDAQDDWEETLALLAAQDEWAGDWGEAHYPELDDWEQRLLDEERRQDEQDMLDNDIDEHMVDRRDYEYVAYEPLSPWED